MPLEKVLKKESKEACSKENAEVAKYDDNLLPHLMKSWLGKKCLKLTLLLMMNKASNFILISFDYEQQSTKVREELKYFVLCSSVKKETTTMGQKHLILTPKNKIDGSTVGVRIIVFVNILVSFLIFAIPYIQLCIRSMQVQPCNQPVEECHKEPLQSDPTTKVQDDSNKVKK